MQVILDQITRLVGAYIPNLIGALAILIVGWLVALLVAAIVRRVLRRTTLDDRLARWIMGEEAAKPLEAERWAAKGVYYLIMLFVLIAFFQVLGLTLITEPLNRLLTQVFEFAPRLLGAGLLLLLAWIVASALRLLVSRVLSAAKLDERIGSSSALEEEERVPATKTLADAVYWLVFLLFLPAALNALALEAITQPASNMLNVILDAIPAIFAALLVLVIAYVVGRVVAGLITNLLAGAGLNAVLARLGLGKEPTEGERTPSDIAGYLVLVAIMLFAAIEASRLLGFVLLADLVAQFTVFVGQVILGLIIFGIGLYLANLASKTVLASGSAQAGVLAVAARVSILVLAGAMALRQMGLANEIINLAFGLLLGAMAVAVALAFGLGGRDIAAHELQEWLQSIRSRES